MDSFRANNKLILELFEKYKEAIEKYKELIEKYEEQESVLKTEIFRLQKTCQAEREHEIEQKSKFMEAVTNSYNVLMCSAAGKSVRFHMKNVSKIFPEISREISDAASQTTQRFSAEEASISRAVSIEHSEMNVIEEECEINEEENLDETLEFLNNEVPSSTPCSNPWNKIKRLEPIVALKRMSEKDVFSKLDRQKRSAPPRALKKTDLKKRRT